MPFILYLSCVILTYHLLSPLGTQFLLWIHESDPRLLIDMSPHIRYMTQLVLLHVPAILVVSFGFMKFHISKRIDTQLIALPFRILSIGVVVYFLCLIGRNAENSAGRFLDQHIEIVLLIARILLAAGALYVLMNPLRINIDNPNEAPSDKGKPGGGGGASDDEAALAALMGLMGGGAGGPPKKGGGGGGMMGRPPRR